MIRFQSIILSLACSLFFSFRGNIGENNNLNCVYDPVNMSDCPIFRVADVLEYAGEDFEKISLKVSLVPTCFSSPAV